MTTADFEREVMSRLSSSEVKFSPQVTYDQDGDCLEILLSNRGHIARRVDVRLTLYFDRETGDLAGGLIKGVAKMIKKILEQMPGFKRDMTGNRVRVDNLLSAGLWTIQDSPEAERIDSYKRLRDKVPPQEFQVTCQP